MAESSSQCPRCRVPMFAATAGATLALGCRQCGGIMIDSESASRMAHDSTTQQLAADTAATAVGAAVDTTTKGIPCPYCNQPMEHRRVFDVDVDICPSHGTWFDRGELQQIASRAVGAPSGGQSDVLLGGAMVGGALAAEAGALEAAHNRMEQVDRTIDVGGVAGEVALGAGEIGVEVAANAGAAAMTADAAGSMAVEGGAAAAEVAAEVAGVAAEGAGTVFGAVLEVMGAIFSG